MTEPSLKVMVRSVNSLLLSVGQFVRHMVRPIDKTYLRQ